MRKVALILAGTSLVGAFLAFHFWKQLQDDHKVIADLRQQVEQLQATRIAESARQGASAVALQPGSAPVAASEPAPVSSVPGTPTVPAVTPVLANATSVTVATNCDEMLTRVRKNSSATSAEMSAELRLAPAEAQRFAEIREAQAVGGFSCGSGAGPAVSQEQMQAQILALLGPGRYEQMQEINTVRTTKSNMATLSTQLAESGAPMSEEQARQLTATILEENRRFRREVSSAVPPIEPRARLAHEEENLKLTELRFERTLKAAQSYLRPEQLAQLRGNTTRQANALRDSVTRMRTSVEAGRGIPSTQPIIVIQGAAPAR